MKLAKIILTFFIVFVAGHFSSAQVKPQAVLSDKWVSVYCEESLSRLDHFFVELQNDPTASGYIVIYYGDKSLAERFGNENQILGHASFRKFETKRLKIVSVNRGDKDVEIQFWKVPQEAELPASATGVKEELSAPTKAVMFGFPGELCPFFSAQHYKAYLDKYPELRGHIVIFGSTIKEAKKRGKYWLQVFDESSIPRDRLRVFYSTADNPGEAEFWLVPEKSSFTR